MRGRSMSFGVGLIHDGGNTVGAAAGNPAGDRARAVRVVASMSGSAEECAALLAALGLQASEGVSPVLAS